MTNRAAVLVSVLVLALLSIVPMSRTIAQSFIERPADGSPAHATLRWYDEAFVSGPPPAAEVSTTGESPATRPVSARWRLLGNSVVIAAIAAFVALLLGVPYALVIARTDVPWRGALGILCAAPLVLPPLLVAFAWTFLPGFEPSPKLVADAPESWGGVAAALRAGFLLGLCYFPLVVLFARRALSRVPASLEEAARLAGGPGLALRRVTLPLAAPGILVGGLFVFLFALNDFSLVDYLNFVRPTSDRISVYPYESFTAWTKTQGESVATALGMPLALVGIVLLFAIQRTIGAGPRAAVTGEFREPAPWRLGKWRMPAAGAAAALVVLAAGLPVAGLALKAGGLDNYRSSWRLVAGPETHGLPWWAPRLVGLAVIAAVVFVTDDKATSTRSRVWMTLARVAVALLGVVLVWVIWPIVVGPNSASHEVAWTLWLSVGAAVLCLPLAFVLGHHAARTGKLKWFALAMLPLAVPPIFLGAGYLKILNSSALSFDGRNPFLDSDGPRLGAMLLLVAKYVPFAIAAMWAAFLEIDPRLEEAAATAGVKPLDRALGILVPLAKPALVLGFVVVFVLSLREIDTIVLLTCDTVMRRIYTMVHYQRDAEVAALCVMLVVMEAAVFAAFALLAPRRAAAA